MTRGKHARTAAAVKVRQESAEIAALQSEIGELRAALAAAVQPERTTAELELTALLVGALAERDTARQESADLHTRLAALEADFASLLDWCVAEADAGFSMRPEVLILISKYRALDAPRDIRRLGKNPGRLRRGITNQNKGAGVPNVKRPK